MSKTDYRVLKLYPHMGHAKYSFDKLIDLYTAIGIHCSYNRQSLTIKCRGRIYHFMSEQVPEKLQGMRFDRIELTETVPLKILHEVLAPIIVHNNAEVVFL